MDDQTQLENSSDYLEQFVGEGKKYKSVEELAKGYANADKFIESLKSYNEDLKTEVQKRMAIEEFIQKKQDNNEQQPAADPNQGSNPAPTEPEAKPEAEPKVDESDLIERIKAELKQDEEKNKAEENKAAVANRLMEVYGSEESVNKAVSEKAAEIGVSVQWLQDTAARSPKAFYSLTGIDGGRPAPSRPNPAVNTAGDPPRDASKPQPGTKAYYDELRKTDMNKFLSREVQLQYLKDAAADREKFFGTS